jgi:Domain of unknown function (DUF932)
MLPAPRRPLQRKSTVCGLNSLHPASNRAGPLYLNPQPVSFLAALALPGLLPRVALLALRFRFEKYAQHTFSTETERRKNSGSSQSLASLLRLTEPTNQSTNMSTALNNNSTRTRVPGTVAISDDEMRRFAPSVFASQPIEGVSERYSFLPTSSILNGMRGNGWVPVRAQEQSVRTEARRGFQKHVVRFARVEHLQTWEKNQVRPEVVLVNSHDKSSAYQLHCGLFRLVCTNGMVVSDGTFQRISIKHSGFNPDSVIEASFKVLTAVPDIMNKVQLFQERLLTDAEQLALATGAAAYRWEDLTKAPVNPSILLDPRRYGDGAKDLWTTLNCVQENIIRGGQRDRSRRRPDGSRMPKSRAIKGVDEDMKLNKALWEMAEVLRNGGAQ